MKKKVEQRNFSTIFDLPAKEVKVEMEKIITDLRDIISSEAFTKLAKKTELPDRVSKDTIDKIIASASAEKIANFFSLIFVEKWEKVLKIASVIFCKKYEDYAVKSVNQIAEDFSKLTRYELKLVLSFFKYAG